MATPSVAATVFKLARAGEQAGFTIEQMIRLLNAGLRVEALLLIVEWKLTHAPIEPKLAAFVARGDVGSRNHA